MTNMNVQKESTPSHETAHTTGRISFGHKSSPPPAPHEAGPPPGRTHLIKGWSHPYSMMLILYGSMILFALAMDSPARIAEGLYRILMARSVLITDYMDIGGIGASLINVATTGIFSVFLLRRMKVNPNGSIIMALWLTAGFSMMGKNLLNMWPILLGVYAHAMWKKEPFIRFGLVALLSATMSPVVSGICFHPQLPFTVRIPLGLCLGILCGFVFPAVSSFSVRIHGGYNLYNLGMAGGLLSTFVVSGLSAFGVSMERELYWSTEYTNILELYMCLVSVFLIITGIVCTKKTLAETLGIYRKLLKHPGRLVSDYYLLYGDHVYLNMGLLGLLSTAVIRLTGADLNGATLCGIFTIIGFGAFGKHIKNVSPIMAGATICAFMNMGDLTSPGNSMAILFCTCLAPIAGEFGVAAGIVTGFLHVNTITHIGFLNSGLNLYNNGYAGGFVAMLMVPVLLSLRKEL